MTLRDEIREDNLRSIQASWFRSLYSGPSMSFEQGLALGCLSLICAAIVALLISQALMTVVK